MKAYIAIKYHPDSSNRPAIESISRALEQSGFDTVCVARDVEEWGRVDLTPGGLMHRSFEATGGSDIVVVDLTEKGVGIGIEAGYAFAKHIPILTIARGGADISATLQGISRQVVWYGELDQLTDCFAHAAHQIARGKPPQAES